MCSLLPRRQLSRGALGAESEDVGSQGPADRAQRQALGGDFGALKA